VAVFARFKNKSCVAVRQCVALRSAQFAVLILQSPDNLGKCHAPVLRDHASDPILASAFLDGAVFHQRTRQFYRFPEKVEREFLVLLSS